MIIRKRIETREDYEEDNEEVMRRCGEYREESESDGERHGSGFLS